jgi:transposase-like protein
MTENQINQNLKRKFSTEEKRSIYIAWQHSDLSLIDFCKLQGISKSAFYKWQNEFKEENSQSIFLPLTMPQKSDSHMTQLTIRSATSDNSVELKLFIPRHRLVSFIKEMCDATSVIR